MQRCCLSGGEDEKNEHGNSKLMVWWFLDSTAIISLFPSVKNIWSSSQLQAGYKANHFIFYDFTVNCLILNVLKMSDSFLVDLHLCKLKSFIRKYSLASKKCKTYGSEYLQTFFVFRLALMCHHAKKRCNCPPNLCCVSSVQKWSCVSGS